MWLKRPALNIMENILSATLCQELCHLLWYVGWAYRLIFIVIIMLAQLFNIERRANHF